MTNFTSRILSSAVSALNAQQAKIAVTSSNIANVNTPGYARRSVDLIARGSSSSSGLGASIGGGVDIGQLQRQTSNFIDRLLRESAGEFQRFQIEDEFLARLEPLFSLTGEFSTIGTSFNSFFAALDDLSSNPASMDLRANVIERATDLVGSIQSTYQTIAGLQTEADQRISVELNTINSLTQQIAELNTAVKVREANGDVAAAERDQRDQLLQSLSEKMSFTITEVSDGTINLSLSNGFVLVSGNQARSLGFTQSPSFAAGAMPPNLSGAALGHIVYDFSNGAGTAEVELTDVIASGDGTLAGLIAMRGYNDVRNAGNTSAFQASGTLVEIASRVESMARFLLTEVNRENLGFSMGDRVPATAGVFDAQSADLDGNPPGVYGLFTFAFGGARDADGDGLPDDLAALGIDNFASILQTAITDPRDVAAGRNVSGGTTLSVPEGDNRNIVALAEMQNTQYAFSTGSFSLTGRISGIYDETVSTVGNKRNSARVNYTVSESNFNQAQSKRDEVSAVSLDEEFTNLIQFQKAFEAAARLIRIADELMEQLVQVI